MQTLRSDSDVKEDTENEKPSCSKDSVIYVGYWGWLDLRDDQDRVIALCNILCIRMVIEVGYEQTPRLQVVSHPMLPPHIDRKGETTGLCLDFRSDRGANGFR